MLVDVVEVRPTEEHRLWLRFDDGSSGEVDLAEQISFDGVFEPLGDVTFFRSVRVDVEAGTIAWPNGADLDPDVLYAWVTGQGVEQAA